MTTSQRSLLVVGALLALCAAAAFLFAGGGAVGPIAVGSGTVARPDVDYQVESGRLEDRDDPDMPTRSRVEVGPQTEDGEGLDLLVVDARTDTPVPGARVCYLEMRIRGGRDRIARELERIEAQGAWVVADGAGIARLPMPSREFAVFGESGDLFGVAEVRRGRDEQRLELQLDETLTVRVVGPDRRPRSGVEVVLAADRVRELDWRAQRATGDDGLAVLEHVQLFRRSLPNLDPNVIDTATVLSNRVATLEQATSVRVLRAIEVETELRVELRDAERELREIERNVWRELRRRREAGEPEGPPQWSDFVVAARVPQATPEVLRFPAANVPRNVVELQLGALGAVEARVIGPDGRPIWMPCDIEVRRSQANPLPAALAPATFDQLRRLTDRSFEKPRGAGSVTIAPIGAGTLLDFEVEFDDDDFNFAVRAVPGPRAGDTSVVELRAPDWLTVLSGRLVDGTGTPIAGLRTELLLTGASGRIEGEALATDDAGRFELPLRLRAPSPPYEFEVQARQNDVPIGALVAVPELRQGGRTELGDIRVASLPTLVAGTVVDDRGEPVDDARVQLQVFLNAVGEEGAWRDIAYVRMQTGEDGTYRLFGAARDEPMRVEIRARGYAGVESPALSLGATYDARLDRLGTVIASGFAPAWLPRRAVRLELLQDGRRVRRDDLRVRGDERFREGIGGLPPGQYDLVAELQGFGEIERLGGIFVSPGSTIELPPVDLRDRLFRYEVRCVDGRGQPIEDPGSPLLAQVIGADGTAEWTAFPWQGDQVEFISSRPSTEVVLLATGHRPARTNLGPGPSQLTLVALQPVEVELPGLRQMVGEGRVRVSLVRVGDTGLPMSDLRAVDQRGGRGRGYSRASLGKSGGAWLDDGDVVSVPLMLDGEYRVVVRLHAEGRRKVVSREVGRIRVEVDGQRPTRASVAVPAQLIQEALLERNS